MSQEATRADSHDPMGKASGFQSILGVIRNRLDPARFAALVEKLTPETRAFVEKPPMPMSWMPSRAFFELLEAGAATGPVEETGFAIGREQMRRDMSTVYKVLMHLASAQTILKKAASIFSTYTKNGKMTSRELGTHEGEIVIEDVRLASNAWWAYQRGCIHGVLEVAGSRGVDAKITSGGGTSSRAVFRVTWK